MHREGLTMLPSNSSLLRSREISTIQNENNTLKNSKFMVNYND